MVPLTGSVQGNVSGQHQSKTVNATTTTTFLYDGLNVVQELNGATPTTNLLTGLGIDETLLRTDSAGARSFLTDGLGSSIALTDSAGVVQSEYTYEPFGKTLGATGGLSTRKYYSHSGFEHKELGRHDCCQGLNEERRFSYLSAKKSAHAPPSSSAD